MSWNERLPYWIVILLLIIFIRQCTGSKPCAPCKEVVSTAAFKKDTVYILDTVYVSGYVPSIQKEFTPVVTATSYTEVDTTAIIADYEKQRMYKDSQNVTNGYVLIFDTVAKNRIKGRSFIANIKKEVVTNTITNTVVERQKPRNQLYLGIGAYGNKTMPINAAGASLMLKTKRDKVYEAGAFVDWNGTVWYYCGMKFKIKIN